MERFRRTSLARHLQTLLLPGTMVIALSAAGLVAGQTNRGEDLAPAAYESAMVTQPSQDTYVNRKRPSRAYGARRPVWP